MDKNAIKKYAVWARRELISRVSQKALQYGITEENIVPASATSVNGIVLSNDEMKQRRALIECIESKGYQQVMEEVAYTWFNRFSALRFMEVNGYLPSHVRVFTDEENNFKPQILAEAINLDFDGLDLDKVYELKDANDNEALFKYLLIVQCNALNPIMPRMFQKISDYTELLFPDNLLREGSVVQQMIELIPEEDWKDAVQVIGWLYQYYNAEKKDQVFADLKKNIKIKKENIPAATQLFTPDWIVRYMVENSLGRLWVEGHPNDEIKSKWKYYLEEAEQEQDVKSKLVGIRKEHAAITPEEIKCIDPCSGSGHILTYMFDVLMQIYEAYGYSAREAVYSIVKNNIYGLDIDERAAQMAYFSVMMKARQYDRRFFSRKEENNVPNVPQPHIYAIVESNDVDKYIIEYFVNNDSNLKVNIESVISELHDAKEYGSILNITPVDFAMLYNRFEKIRDEISIYREAVLGNLLPLVQVAEILAQKYSVVITNPPYMGSNGMSGKLSNFVKKVYPETKSDLFACFIDKGNRMTVRYGFNCMVTMQSWMFLSSLEKMRTQILKEKTITNLMHMDNMVMGIAFGTAVVVLKNCVTKGYKGTYNQVALKDIAGEAPKEFPIRKNRYAQVCADHFFKIPGAPVAYWVSENVINAFDNKYIADYVTSNGQNITGDNNRFLRLFWEIDFNKIGSDYWAKCARGGGYRRYHGNDDNVILWTDEAREHYRKDSIARIVPENLRFRTGITWSYITSGIPSFRKLWSYELFEKAGTSVFVDNEADLNPLLGLLNSIVSRELLGLINPTINYQVRDIFSIPVADNVLNNDVISSLVEQNIRITKEDWDSFETSWDFKRHPLISVIEKYSIERGNIYLSECYSYWKNECVKRFNNLKANEEELNRLFINIYGLQNELSPEIEDREITIRLANEKRDIESLLSYAVGCMFGRYSLELDGVVYAGGKWDHSKFQMYSADKDNIIPICDDDYFEDDIVGRFVKFIEIVYGKESLEENLKFIAKALGGTDQPRDVIRKYFLNEFYTEHCKNYQKRPIYWLFDSGKKNGFKALVYMHRYQSDTIARMRTDYVHEQQSRYRTAITDLEQRVASAATSERVKLNKKLKTLQDQAAEIQVYEEKIHHLADQYISIELDDGVKVNYAKFQDVLAKIK